MSRVRISKGTKNEIRPLGDVHCKTHLFWFSRLIHPTFTDKKVRRPSVAIHFATSLTPFVKPREVLRGYLDVAIAKIRETHMQSCAIDSRTCSYANFLQWLHLNNLAKKLSVKLVNNGRENNWSVKVGCT